MRLKFVNMKRVFFLLIFGFFFKTLSVGQVNFSIKSLNSSDFQFLFDQKKYTLVDIRTEKEFKEGHIKGAINIDYYAPDFVKRMNIMMQNPLMIYGRNDSITYEALEKLSSSGTATVIYTLAGGLVGWKRDRFELIQN